MSRSKANLRLVPPPQEVDFTTPTVKAGWLEALSRSDQSSVSEEVKIVRGIFVSGLAVIVAAIGGATIKQAFFTHGEIPNACTDSPSLVFAPGKNGAPNSAWVIAAEAPIPGAIANIDDFKEEIVRRNPGLVYDAGMLPQRPIKIPGDCE